MFGIFRFVLAVNVMVYHVLAIGVIGPYAVYSFFILSGFLMTHIMHETYGYSLGGFKKYALNRLLRLFPIYWFLLILILAIIFFLGESTTILYHQKMQLPNTLQQWFANAFLIYPDINPVQYEVRLSPPSWALSIEIFFYLLIGLGMTRTKEINLFVFVLSFTSVVFSIFDGNGIGYGTVLEASLPFSLGGLLFHYRQWFKRIVDGMSSFLFVSASLTMLCINILFAIFLTSITQPTFLNLPTWKLGTLCTLFNMFSSCLVIIGLYYTKTQIPLFKKIDRELGDLSYPLYIFHTAAACLVTWFIADEVTGGNHGSSIIVFLVSFLLTIVVCWGSNAIINNRVEAIRNSIKKHSKN